MGLRVFGGGAAKGVIGLNKVVAAGLSLLGLVSSQEDEEQPFLALCPQAHPLRKGHVKTQQEGGSL